MVEPNTFSSNVLYARNKLTAFDRDIRYWALTVDSTAKAFEALVTSQYYGQLILKMSYKDVRDFIKRYKYADKGTLLSAILHKL